MSLWSCCLKWIWHVCNREMVTKFKQDNWGILSCWCIQERYCASAWWYRNSRLGQILLFAETIDQSVVLSSPIPHVPGQPLIYTRLSDVTRHLSHIWNHLLLSVCVIWIECQLPTYFRNLGLISSSFIQVLNVFVEFSTPTSCRLYLSLCNCIGHVSHAMLAVKGLCGILYNQFH